MPLSRTDSNGSPRIKSPLMSKYFQVPGRKGKSLVESGSASSTESLTLPNGQTQRPQPSPGFSNRMQDSPRSASPHNMSFPVPPPRPQAAVSPPASSYNPPLNGNLPAGASLQQLRNASVPADTTKWGVKYNHGHSNGKDQIRKPVPSPRPQEFVDPEQITAPAPAGHKPPHLRKVSADVYTLKPIAYSPIPPSIEEGGWEQQSEAPWVEGYDDLMKKAPTKPPKIPEDQAQMPQIPPRLPPLYFEQDQQVEQMDFAYQRPQHSSRGASQTNLPNIQSEAVQQFSQEETKQSSPTKPSPPPIDTSENPQTPTQGKRNMEKDDTHNSFYWHSPSSHGGESPKPFDEGTPIAQPRKPTDSLVSATALEFGGPSDWEHFGDYEAEEVDDIDLYTSHKAKTAELPENTNSDGNDSDDEILDSDSATLGVHGRSKDKVLSTIQERDSEFLEHTPIVPHNVDDGQGNDISIADMTAAHPPPDPPMTGPLSPPPPEPSLEAEDTDEFVHPGLNRVTTEPPKLPESNLRMSGFDVDIPPSKGEEIPPVPQIQQAEIYNDKPVVVVDDSEKHHPVPTPDIESPVVSSTPTDEINMSETALAPRKSSIKALSPKSSIESVVTGVELTETAPCQSPQLAQWSPRDEDHNSRSSIDKASQFTSPTSDDDDKEDIIISLQIPGTPPLVNKPAPLRLVDVQDRSLSASVATESGPKSPDLLRSGRRSIFPQSIEIEDPYAGLDPWAKASLNRYVKMLRDEALAGSDEEKYMTFVNFTYKETQIRAVLYDMDDESELSDHPVNRVPSKKGAKKTQGLFLSQSQPQLKPLPGPQPQNQAQDGHQSPPQQIVQTQPPFQFPSQQVLQPQTPPQGRHESLQSKALPALPPKNIPLKIPSIQHTPPSEDSLSHLPDSSLPNAMLAQNAPASQDGQNGHIETTSSGVDLVRHNQDLHTEKSLNIKDQASGVLKGVASMGVMRTAANAITVRKPMMTTISQEHPTEASARTKQIAISPTPEPSITNSTQMEIKAPDETAQPPEKTEYKAFNYNNEGKPYIGDKAANRQTIYQPFSTMLRQSSIRSGDRDTIRSFGHGNTSSISSESNFVRGYVEGNNPKSVNYRYTVLEPLLNVIPREDILRQEPEALARLRHGMDAIPDDFSFIHKTMLAWDQEAKKAREPYERERHARQAQSEQRIDELFNANEIGYSDISRLEADFKRSETAKKAEEDREEVQTFVSSVFDVVWARVNYEMDQLTPLYEECTRLAANASAGRDMFGDNPVHVPIAPAMEALLILYHKLNVRHQKAFEAVLERDRRLKKTEVDPYYAVGAIDKVKRIKERFEDAEKKAILEFCRQRDVRANLLMDVLDQNTLRGVGANQDYMESVMQAVRKIALNVALGAVGEDDVVATADVLKAKTITTALARSSEQIVQTFHVADMLLNAADYEVSVANAKLSNADANAFRRLRDAKAKEDSKLALDLEHRMALIRGDTARTQDEIAKLLMLIQRKDDPDNSETVADTQRLADNEKEARLRRALEEAKARNQRGAQI